MKIEKNIILKDFGYKSLPIVFKEGGRPRYKLGDIPLIGTTTVINTRAKDFLMFWTIKEGIKYLDVHWDINRKYTKLEKENLLLLAKKAWTVKKDKALDAGKITHDLIQNSIVKGKRYKIKKLVFDRSEIQEEIRNAYQAFLDWEKSKKKIEYYAGELIVGSKIHYVGGTIDAIAEVDGWLELLDWKTSNFLSEDVFLQTGAYKMQLLEGGVDLNISRRVVQFKKDGSGFKEIKIKSHYSKDVEAFLGLLTNYRWNRDTKKNFMYKNGILKTD